MTITAQRVHDLAIDAGQLESHRVFFRLLTGRTRTGGYLEVTCGAGGVAVCFNEPLLS